MDTLLSNAINGINAMPAKGTCAACSDDELKAAIEYILSQSGQ
jgi:cytochrome c5